MKHLLCLLLSSSLLAGCSIFDPNPGENEADTYIHKKEYEQAINIVEPLAKQGIPWAQLRLGIAYEYGQGKPQNAPAALEWYRKVATQNVALPWGDGVHILSAGDPGYFNQNNDARVAQYLIARMYAEGRKDINKNLPEAWLWAQYVRASSNGKDIVFCCENSKLRTKKIEAARIEKLLVDIRRELPAETLQKLRQQAKDWQPY